MINPSIRYRLLYGVVTIAVIIGGLLSRAYSSLFPELINAYLGDALYALMVYMGMSALFIKQSSVRVAWISLVFCYAVELSQLYHAPWLDTLRATRPGSLVLGHGFLWSDLLAYAMGVGVGVMGRVQILEPFLLKAK